MSDWIEIESDPKHIKREREKARILRKSHWWKNILAQGICNYCEERFSPAELTMDHIVPVCRGGKSVKSNILPCCKDCNSEKKYLTPAEILLKSMEDSGEI